MSKVHCLIPVGLLVRWESSTSTPSGKFFLICPMRDSRLVSLTMSSPHRGAVGKSATHRLTKSYVPALQVVFQPTCLCCSSVYSCR
jgi:hypothetical protein